jgi:hypothetical protein
MKQMREIYRQIARTRMKDAGMKQINKKRGADKKSLFSRFWRVASGYPMKKPTFHNKSLLSKIEGARV